AVAKLEPPDRVADRALRGVRKTGENERPRLGVRISPNTHGAHLQHPRRAVRHRTRTWLPTRHATRLRLELLPAQNRILIPSKCGFRRNVWTGWLTGLSCSWGGTEMCVGASLETAATASCRS